MAYSEENSPDLKPKNPTKKSYKKFREKDITNILTSCDIINDNMIIESNFLKDWKVWTMLTIDIPEKWEFKMFIPDDTELGVSIDGWEILEKHMKEHWIKDFSKKWFLLDISSKLWTRFKKKKKDIPNYLNVIQSPEFLNSIDWDKNARLFIVDPDKWDKNTTVNPK